MFRLIAVLMLSLIISCGGSKDNVSKQEEVQKHKVNFYKVEKVQLPVNREFSGTITAENTVMVNSKVMGYIAKINYTEGMPFKKGAVLVEISSQEINEKLKLADGYVAEADNAIEQANIALKMAEDQLRQANANYDLAEKTYKRYQNLLKNESVSKQEFDQVESQYKIAKENRSVAENNVNLAKERIKHAMVKKNQAIAGKNEALVYVGYTKIVAPFDGVVLEKMMDLGNLTAPGQPILKIGSNKNVVYFYVPESIINKIKLGDEVDVKVSSLNREFKSKVIEISPNIDPATRNFRVKSTAEKDLPVGAYTNVVIVEGVKDAILVPQTAITYRGQLPVVFVNKNGKADMRVVKIGNNINGMVEIIGGLESGEIIVEKNVNNIKSGDLLEG